MTYLRHASRHVHHTVANYIKAQLDVLKWTVPGEVPFDSPVVQIWKTPAVTQSGLNRQVTAGVVSITLGNEQSPDMEEMGGPLASQEYPIFVDVFQDQHATALVLASDVKDILLGRLPTARRSMTVINQATGEPVPDWWIELDDVERVAPDNSFSLHWMTVKVTATAYFAEVRY